MHQESILFFDFKSTGGSKSKCLHCVPAENEQMALLSCAVNNILFSAFNRKLPLPYLTKKIILKKKSLKYRWQRKSMKS